MSFFKPMLASPMADAKITKWSDWAIECKYDGHRLIITVDAAGVRNHSRDGKSRNLPAHLVKELKMLPYGMYDGEILAGGTSTDVTRLDLTHTLNFLVFDIVSTPTIVASPYSDRRGLLKAIFKGLDCPHVVLASSVDVASEKDVLAFVGKVWERGGEGAILKRKAAPYRPGKRTLDFIKIKKQQTAVLTVVGFEPTRGAIMNRGAYAIVVLRDENGIETKVKTLDDAELAKFAAQCPKHGVAHPAIGRKLMIKYQDLTGKSYRSPMWGGWV